MKKAILILLSVIMVLSLAACGSKAPAEPASSNNSKEEAKANGEVKAEGPIEVDFWYSLGGENGEVIEGMIKDFNESQDKIVVKGTFQGDYYENHAKVLTAIASNTQPDITMIEIASIGAFADSSALEDLSKYTDVEGKEFVEDYIPGLMGNSYWKDTLYAIPFNRSTPIMYINTEMLAEAGLDPAGPKSWKELREFSRKLTKEGEVYGFECPIDIWFYEALTFENGGKILTDDGTKLAFNAQEGIEPVEFWQDMIEEGIMKMPPGEKYNAWDVAFQDFVNGKVGMIFTSTGSLNSLLEQAPFEVATGFLPAKKDYGVPTGGANLAILSKSSEEEKKAAWEFAKFMTNTEQTAHFSKSTGYMPARISAVNGDVMKALYQEKPQFKVAIDQLEYAKPRPMVPAYKELQEIIMTEIQRAVIDDSVSVEEALNAAAQKGEKLLK